MSTEIVLAKPIAPPSDRSIVGRVVDKIRSFLVAGGSALDPMIGQTYVNGGWWWADPQTAAPRVNEISALGQPAFGSGVEKIASAAAGVELRAYRYDKAMSIDVRMDPAPEFLRDPDPLSTPWAWKYSMINDLILYGNHFALLGEPNAEGWPRWLHPVDPAGVELGRDSDTGQMVWRVGGRAYGWGSVFHVSAGNKSGRILGRGVIAQYADSLGGVLATDQHARRYFTSGGLPPAILQSDDPELSQPQADQVKGKYRDLVSNGSREPLVLPASFTFTPVVTDADKQQLVDSRKWDAQLVAMILGIDPRKFGLPGASMTYQNIEQEDIAYIRDTVARWTGPVESAVTKWLLPAGQAARFDWSGRLRMDSKARAEVLRLEKEAGVIIPETEGRAMLNRPPLPIRPAVAPPAAADVPQDIEQDPTPEVAA